MKWSRLALVLLLPAWSAHADLQLVLPADPADPSYGSVDFVGVKMEVNGPECQWQDAFAVRVDDRATNSSDVPVPNVLGTYRALDDRVRFTPRFRLMLGLTYTASVDTNAMLASGCKSLGPASSGSDLTLRFALEDEDVATTTAVDSIYPSADVLPENLLRIYVHFSAPMRRGGVQNGITLFSNDGRRIDAAFLDLRAELWDPSMQRLTLLFDPGRIKRGVGPNVERGAPLRGGESYTLVVNSNMKDANGTPLILEFAKTFSVVSAVRDRIDPHTWSVVAPKINTRQPVALGFARSLDHAMLKWALRVVDDGGRSVDGQISIGPDESNWRFTPADPWVERIYKVLVTAELEDVSGNNLIAPFDVKASDAELFVQDVHELPFETTSTFVTRN